MKALGLTKEELSEGVPGADGEDSTAGSAAGVRKRPASVNPATGAPSKMQKRSGELPPGGQNLRPGSTKTLKTGGLDIPCGGTAGTKNCLPPASSLRGSKLASSAAWQSQWAVGAADDRRPRCWPEAAPHYARWVQKCSHRNSLAIRTRPVNSFSSLGTWGLIQCFHRHPILSG